MRYHDIIEDLLQELASLRFGPPVTHVYNPLEYAREPYDLYLKRFGAPPKEAILLGMNPGPWGMVQTGIPFGEVRAVREWMGISASVGQPVGPHPKRPVEGFACKRSEVSGRRLWGWAEKRFGRPERFFARFIVLNYCPLVFMEAGGRNRTPNQLRAEERAPLLKACDRALRRTVERLAPRHVIGVGKFAEERARASLAEFDMEVGCITHPSPANPKANQGWERVVEQQLSDMGVLV